MLLKIDRTISLSISCTTRPKRKGEIDKKDYIFLSDKQFLELKKKNKFLEHAEVFGYNYGTLKNTVLNFFENFCVDSFNQKLIPALYWCWWPPRGDACRASTEKMCCSKRTTPFVTAFSHF